jgi:hypothetical protein
VKLIVTDNDTTNWQRGATIMSTQLNIGTFEQGKEDWVSYTERLEQYFTAFDIDAAAKQRAYLLSVCGALTYQVICNLAALKKPTKFTFKEIVKMVRDHYSPQPSENVQRFTFHSRAQKEGETIAQYASELHRLSEHCNFGDTLEDMLRDRIVCGLRDERIQRRLLAEAKLTFAKAFELCQASELAEKNSKSIQAQQTAPPIPVMALHRSQPPRKRSTEKVHGHNLLSLPSPAHLAHNCPAKSLTCNKCGRKGHLAKACKSTRPQQSQGSTKQSYKAPHHTHQVHDTDPDSEYSSSSEEEVRGLYKIATPKVPPLKVSVTMNGTDVVMEVDTGASLSVMSENTYNQLWNGHGPTPRPTQVKLKTYTGEPLQVKGRIDVTVRYNGHTETIGILVIAGSGPTFMGRDWLQKIRLDWNTLYNVRQSNVLEKIVADHK